MYPAKEMGRRIPIHIVDRMQPLEAGQTPNQGHSPTYNHQNPTNTLVTEGEVVSAKIQPSTSEEQHRAAEQDYWRRQLRLAKWMNWITGVAAIVGLGGLFVIWETLRVTQEQTRAEMTQAETARETLRARITMTEMERASDIAPNVPIYININWKNAGGSTAFDIISGSMSWICDGPLSVDCIKRALSERDPLSKSPTNTGTAEIGEEGFFTVTFVPQSTEVIDALKNGTKTAYFAGAIRYRDIFSEVHTFRFCAYFLTGLHAIGRCPINNAIEQQKQ